MSFGAIAIFGVIINSVKLHPVIPMFLAIVFVALRAIEGYKFAVLFKYLFEFVVTEQSN